MKKLLKVLTLLTVTIVLASCSTKKDTLKVGMELQYKPFEYKETDGTPNGVSVEMAKQIAKELGKEVEIVDTAFPGLITALQTDKVDLVISSMTITDDRKDQVDFTIPYANAYLTFLTNDELVKGITDYKELNDPKYTIAVKKGTTGEKFVTTNLPKANIRKLDGTAQAIEEVNQGKSDAFIYDSLTITEAEKKTDGTSILKIEGIEPETWGIAVKKNNDKIDIDKINEVIESFKVKDTGLFSLLTNPESELKNTYLIEHKKNFDNAGLNWFFDFN